MEDQTGNMGSSGNMADLGEVRHALNGDSDHCLRPRLPRRFRPPSTSSYLAILDRALVSLEAGNVQLARTHLNAFASRVRSQAGKQLTPATSDVLLLAANRIIAGAEFGYF